MWVELYQCLISGPPWHVTGQPFPLQKGFPTTAETSPPQFRVGTLTIKMLGFQLFYVDSVLHCDKWTVKNYRSSRVLLPHDSEWMRECDMFV